MALSLLKTGALAATVLVMTVSGAFAASYGYINYDTKVKKSWSSGSPTIDWVDEGDKVQIVDYTKKNGGWFKINPPGPNNTGWVKKSAVDVWYDDDYDDEPGVQFCFSGPLGYLCVNK
ncbi:MAG: SH3 domain-containing protein [Devosia sp.]